MLSMQLGDFSYNLPEELIAKRPVRVRGQSRLLVLGKNNGSITHSSYGDVVNYLHAGDVVVLNDTRVIKARLEAINSSGQKRELLLLEKHSADKDWHIHKVLYRGKIRKSERLRVADVELNVRDILEGGIAVVESAHDLLRVAHDFGTVPLPPYIKRQADKSDTLRYQTEFASDPGSVAAPTASLNFTGEIIKALEAKGVTIAYLTLHVGLGTFLPIRTDDIEQHTMHSEYFEIPAATVAAIQSARKTDNKVFAIGTTVARTLEYAHRSIELGAQDISGEADIFIYPGYQFKAVDGLLTNFHAPKSTVLMLAAAFAGWENLEKAYREAIRQKYALLSYGDSMLII